MLRFEFFDAAHGDAYLCRGDDPDTVMLIDGGPTGLYEASLRDALRNALPRNAANTPHIAALCLSHVDDDHAAGVLRLLLDVRRARNDDEEPPFAVDRLWFNSVDRLVESVAPGLGASAARLLGQVSHDKAVSASYAQGWAIRNQADFLGLGSNDPFGGELTRGKSTTLGDLEVTVIAPDETALQKLAAKWREAEALDDAKVIAAAYRDRSIPNLSSIVLLVGHGTSTALLTGDARGDHILKGLEASGLLAAGATLHLGLLKLPHHGSDKNMAPGLFTALHADHYVISANGTHDHPRVETIDALVASRDPGDEYTVHLTNRIPFAVDRLTELQADRRFLISVRSPGRSLRVDLAR